MSSWTANFVNEVAIANQLIMFRQTNGYDAS